MSNEYKLSYTAAQINSKLGEIDYLVKDAELGSLAKKDIISKTDVSSDIQTSLNKADTALQSFTETDPTVPAWAKSATKPAYTADEVGAAPLEYTKKVGNPYNFLINSDFRNPVNQKGQTSYKGGVEGIDKWSCTSNNWMVTVEDGCIMVSDNPDSSSTSTAMIRQTITVPPNLRGKTVTLAARLKGSDVRLNINNKDIGGYAGADDWHVKVVTGTVPADAETIFIALQCRNMVTWYCEWAALYEGEYTTETLPEYNPKGYYVELLNCGGINADYVNAFVNGGRISDIDSLDEDGIHETDTNSTGTFPSELNSATGVLFHKTWDANYKEQIFMSFGTRQMYHRTMSAGVWKQWNQIATTDYALPRDGSGTMMGDLKIKASGSDTSTQVINFSSQTVLRNIADNNNYHDITMADGTLDYTGKKAGTSFRYNILHTGNKPSGSYTGNGSATERSIAMGGAIGNAVLVWSDNGAIVITRAGGFGTKAFDYGACHFEGDYTKIATTDALLNANGVTYHYQVL